MNFEQFFQYKQYEHIQESKKNILTDERLSSIIEYLNDETIVDKMINIETNKKYQPIVFLLIYDFLNFVNYIDEKITKMLINPEDHYTDDFDFYDFDSEDYDFIENFTPKRLLKCQDKVAISALLVGTLLQSLV